MDGPDIAPPPVPLHQYLATWVRLTGVNDCITAARTAQMKGSLRENQGVLLCTYSGYPVHTWSKRSGTPHIRCALRTKTTVVLPDVAPTRHSSRHHDGNIDPRNVRVRTAGTLNTEPGSAPIIPYELFIVLFNVRSPVP
eukprot:COSAG02_NODE_159_length_32891_cov_17.822518_11_plen_139_part_00